MNLHKLLPLAFLFALALAACAGTPGSPAAVATSPAALTPYATFTQTPTLTPTPVNAPTATLAPTATPTPRIYIVQEKDTLGVIAYRNGITVDELKAANPTVDPYLMPVGTKLIIPLPQNAGLTPPAAEPTLVPVQINSVECAPAATGGQYCFAWVTNTQQAAVVDFSAEFTLTDPSTGNVVTQIALFPLSSLDSGTSLPLYAYFAPPVAAQPLVDLKVLTSGVGSTPQKAGIEMHPPKIDIAADGFSATISGDGTTTEAAAGSKTVTVTAISFDEQGRVNGIRRLELPVEPSTSSAITYSLNVYSSRGTIASVSVYVQTEP